MTETSRQYFSGSNLGQALLAASVALGIRPERIRYQPVEGRHTSWKGTRRIVIAVDPAEPELPAPVAAVTGAARERVPGVGSQAAAARAGWSPETPEEAEAVAAVELSMRFAGLDLEVEARSGEGGVDVELFGRDARRAVGRHGEVLRALEHLATRICGERFPLRVDCDGFRARQDRALEGLAREACAAVMRDGRAVLLDPMSPPERRIVHLIVKQAGLRSESLGDGFLKRVEISLEPAGAE